MKNIISFVIYLVLINFQGCKVFDGFTKQYKTGDSQISTTEEAKNKVFSDMISLEASIDTFLLNTNQYPKTLEELIVDPGFNGWAGPYIKASKLHDPWGNPYIYIPHPKSYQLISHGADGIEGGEGINADIYND